MESLEIFNKIIKYKKKNKLTFEQLARELDIPENYIYRWRSGSRISRANKKVIANFFEEKKQ